MTEIIKRENHLIDADGKVLGKLAVEIANLLRGKNKPSFVLHRDDGDFVTIRNVNKMKFTGNKFNDKIYHHYTGFHGGLKSATMKEISIKKGHSEILRMAVMGMLTKNKLRALQIKRLRFEK
jgi:large subunit ribosomal protein L13